MDSLFRTNCCLFCRADSQWILLGPWRQKPGWIHSADFGEYWNRVGYGVDNHREGVRNQITQSELEAVANPSSSSIVLYRHQLLSAECLGSVHR